MQPEASPLVNKKNLVQQALLTTRTV